MNSALKASDIPYELGLHQIAPGTYAYLQPDGGWGLSNAGLIVGKGESFLVDTLFDVGHTQRMLDSMSEITESNPIVAALNSHENGDHCWGNQLLPSSTKIYAMKNCCDALSCVPINMIKKLPSLPTEAFSTPHAEHWFKKKFTSKFDHSTIKLRRPDIPLDESTTIEIGGRRIELIYFGPAHTEGDMVAYVPDVKILFAGDLLFFKGIPQVWAGPFSSWIRILDIFLSMDVDLFVPGHGPVGTKDDVRDVRDILSFFIETATKAYEHGFRDPVKVAYQTKFPEKWRGYGEQERMVLNMCIFWKELDPDYKEPEFFDLMCIAGEYDKFLTNSGGQRIKD